MANLNKVLLIGRLTRDPETRSVASGNAVVSFGLAVNRTYTRRDSGEKVEETCFVDVEAWGRTGETIARYMKKGRQIFIEGRLKFDSWERDGQRRSKLSVVADTFQFIDSNASRDGDSGGGWSREGGSSGGGGARKGRAPVGARETPQDDYGDADDIPF
jgi:single-strand DNA-binding protein